MITTALALATAFLSIYGIVAMFVLAWQATDIQNLKKDLEYEQQTVKKLERRIIETQ